MEKLLLRWHQLMQAFWPMDSTGVRFLLGDIALLQSDHHAALQEHLKGAPSSLKHWYQAALISFLQGDYVDACPTCGGELLPTLTLQKLT
jgi:hypothetical protein